MNADLKQEQERVRSITATIAKQIGKLENETGSLRDEVVEIRKHFWDDVTVNKENPDDLLETFISMKQQAEVLSQRERSHRQAFKRLSSLRRMRESPYFGRIDFAEEGTSSPERVYIGVSSLTDDSGEQFLVYDWRAPISSVYYDFPPGPAEYDTPGGLIRGILDQKWQYVIRGGKIISLFDTGLTIGDDLLQQVLGRNTDTHMRSIVATIQQEQNRIIRFDRSRLLIVHGAAGSGKTSAALQRIAYLLYKYRERLKADQIILFSPNAMFNSYVSAVLPELGEENMQQATFQEYLFHRLSGSFDVEDPYEQLEYVLTAKGSPQYETRTAGIRFKASGHFFEALKLYRQSLETSGMLFKGLIFRGQPIVTSKQINERFYGSDTSLRFQNRIEKLTEWLMDQIDRAEKEERGKAWVQEEIQLLSNEDYQKAYVQLRKKRSYTEETFDDYDRETEALARMVVRRKLKPLRYRVKTLRYIDMKGIYKQLFSDPRQLSDWTATELPEQWEAICRLTVRMLDENKLSYEDATPYLLLKELIEGFQTNVSIKHVLVDEAQDYSSFQFEFLKRLFPSAKMTVLGDFNQAIFAHASESADFNPLTGLYGAEETETMRLTRSYRSTRPIVEFTRALVPGGEEIAAFDREGEKPAITIVSDRTELHNRIKEKIAELGGERYETVAVICKTASEAADAFEGLRDIPGLKLVTSGAVSYEQGAVVIPAYLAKGIEFDAVIVYNASHDVYSDNSVRRLLYTACTRAMHQLEVYSIGALSSIISDVDPSLYVMKQRQPQ